MIELNEKLKIYIKENRNSNVRNLALQKSKLSPEEKRIALQQISGFQTIFKKIPSLADFNDIIYPPKLNIEQTSSEATASFKSEQIKGSSIADITGGFGIDTMFFAKKFDSVYHVEQNKSLQKIASSNFKTLGLDNVLSFYTNAEKFHEEIDSIDWVYLDPARRSQSGSRVYAVEDLEPNPNIILPLYKDIAKSFMIKLSPMTDIEWIFNHLCNIQKVYCIAVKNEMREVLAIGNFYQKPNSQKVIAVNLDKEIYSQEFNRNDKHEVKTSGLMKYLYLPFKSILKSGYSDNLCFEFGVAKIHRNSQLFTSNQIIKNFPGYIFELSHLLKNPKKQLKNKSVRVIRRNYPLSTKEICKKYKCTTDGIKPVFFSTSIDGTFIAEAKQIH